MGDMHGLIQAIEGVRSAVDGVSFMIMVLAIVFLLKESFVESK